MLKEVIMVHVKLGGGTEEDHKIPQTECTIFRPEFEQAKSEHDAKVPSVCVRSCS